MKCCESREYPAVNDRALLLMVVLSLFRSPHRSACWKAWPPWMWVVTKTCAPSLMRWVNWVDCGTCRWTAWNFSWTSNSLAARPKTLSGQRLVFEDLNVTRFFYFHYTLKKKRNIIKLTYPPPSFPGFCSSGWRKQCRTTEWSSLWWGTQAVGRPPWSSSWWSWSAHRWTRSGPLLASTSVTGPSVNGTGRGWCWTSGTSQVG